MNRLAAWFALGLSLVLLTACSIPGSGPGLKVSDPWVRAAPKGDNSAAYFAIANDSAKPNALLSARSNVAMKVEVHESSMGAGGKMMMQPVEQVPVPAKGKAELKPGGYHVMFMGLSRDLNAGEKIDITLHFQSGDEITITAEVRNP